jgi:hypothetical protein
MVLSDTDWIEMCKDLMDKTTALRNSCEILDQACNGVDSHAGCPVSR